MKEPEKRKALANFRKPTLLEFLQKTLSFELHEWQQNCLVPILEQLISPGCASVQPAPATTPKAKPSPGHAAVTPASEPSEPVTRHPSSVTQPKGQRILIHAPPQYGKSIIVSKRFPAWALGIDPTTRIVLAGYNLDHAAGFAEVVRDTMAGQSYRDLFPQREVQIQRTASREKFSTAARRKLKDGQDSVTAVGLLSGFTGKGADILIIDDPYASPDDARSEAINERVWRWWNELAKVRIDENSNVLVMFHRYHEDDFAGRLLAQGGWQYYRFPAIADTPEPPPTAEQRQASTFGGAFEGGPGYADVPSASATPPQAEPSPGCAGVPSAPETPPQAEPGHRTRDTGHLNPESPSQADPNDKEPLADRSEAEGGQQKLNLGDDSAGEARRIIASEDRLAQEGQDPTARRPGELLSPMRTRAYLKEIEDRDPMVWLGQFQGRPRAPEGAFIKREWLKEINPNQIPRIALWVRFWDLATKADQKADFFAGALVGVGPDQTVYIRDVTRFRAEWPDAREIIAETTRRDNLLCQESGAQYEVGLEQVAWMRGMIQDLFTLPIFQSVRLTPVKPDGDKKERSSGWVARARNDMLRISKDYWNADFIQECLAFDGLGHSHDDQIDSVSGAFSLLWYLKGKIVEEKQLPAPGSYRFYKELAEANRWGIYAEEDDPPGLGYLYD